MKTGGQSIGSRSLAVLQVKQLLTGFYNFRLTPPPPRVYLTYFTPLLTECLLSVTFKQQHVTVGVFYGGMVDCKLHIID